jgi:hypothetical protein
MTPPPAAQPSEFPRPEDLTDSEKLDVMYLRVEWLYVTLTGLLQTMQSNPMGRMMMKGMNR